MDLAMPAGSGKEMPQAGASIWLLPSRADAAFFDSLIRDLAGRFGAPVFWSHLTLAGDLTEVPDAYIGVLDRLAESCRSFTQPIADIELTDAYFRSFFARFARSADLDALKKVCVDSVGGSLSGFMPHVSLLYGSVPEPGKSEAAAELRRAIKGRIVTFDRVVVTNSSDTTPIYEWRVHAERSLRPI
jgi:2'-5' RNA ligase